GGLSALWALRPAFQGGWDKKSSDEEGGRWRGAAARRPMSGQTGAAEAKRCCALAREHWAAGRADAAVAEAWAAYRYDPENVDTKTLLAGLAGEVPASVGAQMRAELP